MSAERRAFRVDEFCENHRIGRSKFQEEVAAGRLRVVRIGRRVLVTADDADKWLANLPTAWTPRASSAA